jgi:hypothetical protein
MKKIISDLSPFELQVIAEALEEYRKEFVDDMKNARTQGSITKIDYNLMCRAYNKLKKKFKSANLRRIYAINKENEMGV